MQASRLALQKCDQRANLTFTEAPERFHAFIVAGDRMWLASLHQPPPAQSSFCASATAWSYVSGTYRQTRSAGGKMIRSPIASEFRCAGISLHFRPAELLSNLPWKFDDLRPCTKLIQIVAPPLGHFDPLFPMCPAMIGGAHLVVVAMCKRTFDRICRPLP